MAYAGGRAIASSQRIRCLPGYRFDLDRQHAKSSMTAVRWPVQLLGMIVR